MTTASSRSLKPQSMFVKYLSDVPPVSTIASIAVAPISRRAFSSRATRSAVVIGTIRPAIEVSAAMAGGTGLCWIESGVNGSSGDQPAPSPNADVEAATDPRKSRRVVIAILGEGLTDPELTRKMAHSSPLRQSKSSTAIQCRFCRGQTTVVTLSAFASASWRWRPP